MRKFVLGAIFLGLFVLPLMAQDTPKAEVFGGYQYQYLGGDFTGLNTNGWDASVTANINKHFGIAGQFGGVYKSETVTSDDVSVTAKAHLYDYTFGPVIAMDFSAKINPFVHVLFGGFTIGGTGAGCLVGSGSESCASASASTNGLAMKFGGGVDYNLSKRIAIRPIQFDWNYYHANGQSESSNISIATGIVIRF